MKSEALRGFWKRVGLKIWRTFSVGKSTKATAFRESFSGNLDWKWDKPPYKRFRYNKEHATILENSAEADTIHKIEGTLIANMCETSQMRKPSFMHFPGFPHCEVRNRPFQINFAVVWPNWILKMDLTSFSSSHRTGLRLISLCLPIFFGEVLLEIQICYVCNVQGRVSQNE